MSTFLSDADISALTGIRRGRGGKSRAELQIDWLRRSGVPFWVNALGRPIVARAAIEGGAIQKVSAWTWVPDVLRG